MASRDVEATWAGALDTGGCPMVHGAFASFSPLISVLGERQSLAKAGAGVCNSGQIGLAVPIAATTAYLAAFGSSGCAKGCRDTPILHQPSAAMPASHSARIRVHQARTE
jgi:hypothetical protein